MTRISITDDGWSASTRVQESRELEEVPEAEMTEKKEVIDELTKVGLIENDSSRWEEDGLGNGAACVIGGG